MSAPRGWARMLGTGALGLGLSCALVASSLSPVAAAPVNVAAALKTSTLQGARDASTALTRNVPGACQVVCVSEVKPHRFR